MRAEERKSKSSQRWEKMSECSLTSEISLLASLFPLPLSIPLSDKLIWRFALLVVCFVCFSCKSGNFFPTYFLVWIEEKKIQLFHYCFFALTDDDLCCIHRQTASFQAHVNDYFLSLLLIRFHLAVTTIYFYGRSNNSSASCAVVDTQ